MKASAHLSERSAKANGSGKLLSFVIAAYNAQETLAQCIASITNQGVEAIEIVCIDDGSTDHTASVLADIAERDSRVVPIQLPQNQGAPVARNTGLGITRGEFVAFMDADDELIEGSLQLLLNEALDSGCTAIKGTMLVDRGDGRPTAHKLNQKESYAQTDLASCPAIQHLYQYTTYLFRRTVLLENELYFDESLRNFQDPEYLSRVLPRCAHIRITLIPIYRRHIREGSIISSVWGYENYLSLARGAVKVLDNLRKAEIACAEPTLATFITWWYKFESMTEVLSKAECLRVYAAMQPLCDQVSPALAVYGASKASALHAMQLLKQGRFEDCYRLMVQSSKLHNRLPRSLVKPIELLRLLKFRLFEAKPVEP
ncbi:MAG: glycosyltransferase [Gammaproteobacteria bacterium]|nr:glycosyltransferase [Gammaproteobacteria bacterium]